MSTSRRARPARADRGVATVLAAFAVAALLALACLLIWLGGAIVARHRANGAADLAALAAAGQAGYGTHLACDRAGRVAGRMRATITRCVLVRQDAFVELRVQPIEGPIRLGAIPAKARAGPADHPP